MTFDFKKEYKALYAPATEPSIVDVLEMTFIMVDGKGNPNTSAEYKTALEVLYGLSYAVKMSKMGGAQPAGYFDFVVPPLEGLWWNAGGGVVTDITDKDSFCWTSMIRQPDFVTPELFESIKTAVAKKKAELDLSAARLQKFTEGLCAQILHIGSYDDEPGSTAVLEQFIADSGYSADFTNKRRHHEIYLSDPRKTAPEKLKTIIRYPIAKGAASSTPRIANRRPALQIDATEQRRWR
ncbi:MAG: GyrI-like domain-containing protein [Spirochaetaceae bacterium]|nr:GyrI-like domain-containing protein [Spirochaetaceae bacterium]